MSHILKNMNHIKKPSRILPEKKTEKLEKYVKFMNLRIEPYCYT